MRLKRWIRSHRGWFNPRTQWCTFCLRYERPGERFDFITPMTQAFQAFGAPLAEILLPASSHDLMPAWAPVPSPASTP